MPNAVRGNSGPHGVKLLGYSERGMINAIIHDLQRSPRCAEHLSELLKLTRPRLELPSKLTDIVFLVEQSFSEFGDADLVILFHGGDGSEYVVFIEAKVACGKSWDLETQALSVFRNKAGLCPTQSRLGDTSRVNNSDLLTQLYFKKLMVETISEGRNMRERPTGFGKKANQSLGNNSVVQAAKNRVSEHLSRVFYIGLIPSDKVALDSRTSGSTTSADKFLKEVSYISWVKLHEYCKLYKNLGEFPLTIDSFAYNGEQIYLGNKSL